MNSDIPDWYGEAADGGASGRFTAEMKKQVLRQAADRPSARRQPSLFAVAGAAALAAMTALLVLLSVQPDLMLQLEKRWQADGKAQPQAAASEGSASSAGKPLHFQGGLEETEAGAVLNVFMPHSVQPIPLSAVKITEASEWQEGARTIAFEQTVNDYTSRGNGFQLMGAGGEPEERVFEVGKHASNELDIVPTSFYGDSAFKLEGKCGWGEEKKPCSLWIDRSQEQIRVFFPVGKKLEQETDIDGDGEPELIVTEPSNRIMIYKRNVDGTKAASVQDALDRSSTFRLELDERTGAITDPSTGTTYRYEADGKEIRLLPEKP